MFVTLHTRHAEESVILSFDENEKEPAGTIERIKRIDGLYWRHLDPDGNFTGPARVTLKAAEYDALAWAEEFKNG